MPVRHLTEAEVRSLLTMDEAITTVESAFRKLSLDEAVNLSRGRCQTDHVMLHVLPAAVKTLNALGFKAYTTGKFPARFQVFLFDPKAGGLMAILDADHLGAVRTGAASGVATKKLARKDAATVGLFGTGKQARTQLEAVCRVRTVRHVAVYSRDEASRLAFAAEMTRVCGTTVEPVDTPRAAAVDRDVIITATCSREPVLLGEWLTAGCHINLIGSNFLAKTEADVAVFRRAGLIVADSKEQARLEAGDFVAALNDGVFTWADVGELSHVVTGRQPGRESADQITVFKSLGLGIEDVAVAVKVYEKAVAQNVGRMIDL